MKSSLKSSNDLLRIRSYIDETSRTQASRLQLILFFVLATFSLCLILGNQISATRGIAAALSHGIENAVRTGDEFEVTRQLSTAVESGAVSRAIVIENKTGLILLSRPQNLKIDSINFKQIGFGLHFNPFTIPLELTWRIAINDSLSSPYSLVVTSSLPMLSILFFLFLIFSLIFTLGLLFRRGLVRISNYISEPIVQIYEKIGQIDPEKLNISFSTPQNILEIHLLEESLLRLFSELQRYRVMEKDLLASSIRAEIVKKVVHDIRSPLAALNVLLRGLDTLPEQDRQLAKMAIGRITEIANDLLSEVRSQSVLSHVHLASMLSVLISEKRLEFSDQQLEIGFDFSLSGYSVFANVREQDIKRVLSNIINNAVQANYKNRPIQINIVKEGVETRIDILDQGCGISAEVLKRLGKEEFTFGKGPAGAGIGIFSASQLVKQWNGRLEFSSKEQEGTKVSLFLPIVDAPNWFLPKITVSPDAEIWILDDDPSIHAVWKKRFFDAGLTSERLKSYFSAEDLKNLKPVNKQTICLFDYDLKSDQSNGLKELKRLSEFVTFQVLVTSLASDEVLQKDCDLMGIKLLDKRLASLIPIETL